MYLLEPVDDSLSGERVRRTAQVALVTYKPGRVRVSEADVEAVKLERHGGAKEVHA